MSCFQFLLRASGQERVAAAGGNPDATRLQSVADIQGQISEAYANTQQAVLLHSWAYTSQQTMENIDC